jgi:hypothetical protein
MKRPLLSISFAATLVALTASAYAEEQGNAVLVGFGNSERAPAESRTLKNNEVPDRVAFMWLAKLASAKPEFTVAFVTRVTRDDVDSAKRLVTFLGELHDEMMFERRDAESRVACMGDVGRATPDYVYRQLDLIDEVRAAVDNKYLVFAQANVGIASLRPLLDDLKLGITFQSMPARVAYKDAPTNVVISVLTNFCQARR